MSKKNKVEKEEEYMVFGPECEGPFASEKEAVDYIMGFDLDKVDGEDCFEVHKVVKVFMIDEEMVPHKTLVEIK